MTQATIYKLRRMAQRNVREGETTTVVDTWDLLDLLASAEMALQVQSALKEDDAAAAAVVNQLGGLP